MTRYSRTLAATLIGFSGYAQADFELGYRYYQAKNYENAYKEFLHSGELGDKDAQLNLGIMQYRGEFVPKNYPKAYAWLSLANQPRLEPAEKALSILSKKMTPAEVAEGEAQLKSLAEHNSDPQILKRLAPDTQANQSVAEPYKILKKVGPIFPARAVELGEFGTVDVSFTVAKDGSARDISTQTLAPDSAFEKATATALRQWQFIPAANHGAAINSYGARAKFNFALGNSAKLDGERLNKHLAKLKEKAINGTATDQFTYAMLTDAISNVVKGVEGQEKQKAKIIFDNPNEWYFKSASAGMPVAEFQIGMNILSGKMCTQNTNAGLDWLERAATKGLADAQFQLGGIYYEGNLAEKDTLKGLYWLEKASKSGFANAALKLAWIYATTPDTKLSNAANAKTYFAQVKNDHPDQLSYFETQAAVAALSQDFPAAVKAQKKALALAADYGLNLPTQKLQLAKYEAGQAWLE